MRLLITTFLILVGKFSLTRAIERGDLANIYEGLGHSASCVASALATCENSAGQECTLQPELKSTLQEIKCDRVGQAAGDALQDEASNSIIASMEKMSKLLQELKSEKCEQTQAELKQCQKNMSNHLNENKQLKNKIKEARNCSGIEADFKKPKNCAEILLSGDDSSGLRTIYPFKEAEENKPLVVFCDQSTDGGGWAVFQRRDDVPNRENFYRNWANYTKGFGDVSGEFWMGLENLHHLVNSSKMELRVDLEDYEGRKRMAKYETFNIGDSSSKYMLNIGSYSGDSGDSLSYNNGMKFSTHDQDNDRDFRNCAERLQSAWWFKECFYTNLNGMPTDEEATSPENGGIVWYLFRGGPFYVKKTSMKVRPL